MKILLTVILVILIFAQIPNSWLFVKLTLNHLPDAVGYIVLTALFTYLLYILWR